MKSSLDKKYLIAGLSFLIGLFAIIGAYQENMSFEPDFSDWPEKRSLYHEASPKDKKFYEDAFVFAGKMGGFPDKDITAGIIPHHLFAADLIARFFKGFAGRDFDTIILLGPNHFFQGQADVIISREDWKTPYGILRCDQEAAGELLKDKNIKTEEDIFKKEHSIFSEAAFIKKTFPKAKFLPIVMEPRTDEQEAERIAERLQKIASGKKILVLASVDFSHNTDGLTAQANDRESLNNISNFKYADIYKSKFDSPPSIYALLKYSELMGAKVFKLLENSNSAFISGKDIKDATSYVTGYFYRPEEKPASFLFFGDMMLDRHIGERIRLKGVGSIFKDFEAGMGKYGLVSANLEGAVTDKGAHYPPVFENDFAFSLETVKSFENYGFNFFNIANNHVSDQGNKGMAETRKNLDSAGFDYSGCPDGRIGVCSAKIKEINGEKIGLAGFSLVYKIFDLEKAENIISDLKNKTDLIAVNIHWGREYEHNFNKLQEDVAHRLVDAGADIIIGHHPHVVQGIEIYGGRPIFYSLGNFLFDQYFSIDTQEELGVGIEAGGSSYSISLFPIQSEATRLRLMDDAEKKIFLEKLAGWSVGDDGFKETLKNGKFEIKK